MAKDLVVKVDTREKRPLQFPAHIALLTDPVGGVQDTYRVHVVREKLDAGDYLLGGYEGHTIVERKGNLDEVAQNCLTPDRVRFEAALRRLQRSCSRPVLMLEGSPTSLLAGATLTHRTLAPGVALDALLWVLAEVGVELVAVPTGTETQRRAAGEFVLRKLWAGAQASCSVGMTDVDTADLPVSEL